MRPGLLLPGLCLLLALPAFGEDAEPEIEYLLSYVSESECTFIRNGDAHDPAAAADHLQLKYKRGKRYVNSAEQFIDRLATESSWSGDPYTVECQGETEATGSWLHKALAEHRQAQPTD